VVRAEVYTSDRIAGHSLRTVPTSGHFRIYARTDVLVARMVDRYLRWVAARSSCSCVDESGRPIDDLALQSRIDRLVDGSRPTLVVYWISDTMTLAIVALSMPPFLRLLRAMRVLVDSTIAGRSTGRFLELRGGRYSILRDADDPARLSELRDLMQSRTSCALAVDGGGPYLHVRPGLVAFASSVEAVVVPLSAWASRAFPLTIRSKVRLPLPGCRITVAVGAPQVVARRQSRTVQAASIAASLIGLRDLASREATRTRDP
jgi:hypothetical protein